MWITKNPEANVHDIAVRLAAPFPPEEVRWKPLVVKGNRALAIAYLNARAIMDRLDDVVGPAQWEDEYMSLGDGSVICHLTVYFDGKAVKKCDVGSPSEQPDSGDRLKAAFSDSFKRAATKFGIGRYIHRLPQNWVDYDPVKKMFVGRPALPAWALPKPVSHRQAVPPIDGLKPASAVLKPPGGPGEITEQELVDLLIEAKRRWEDIRPQVLANLKSDLRSDCILSDLNQSHRVYVRDGLKKRIAADAATRAAASGPAA